VFDGSIRECYKPTGVVKQQSRNKGDFFADDLLTIGGIYREEDGEQLKRRSSTKVVSSRNGCYQGILWPAFTGKVTAVSVATVE
jgi:hypothetical protein